MDKPLGWTSSDVVRKMRVLLRRLGHRKIKVGHAGRSIPSLRRADRLHRPATKRVDELQAEEKEYLTTVRLGATTPSYDLEHPVDQTYPYGHVTESRSWPRYRRWKENSCRSRPFILRR